MVTSIKQRRELAAIEAKLVSARQLCAEWAEKLRVEAGLGRVIDDLIAAATAVSDQMAAMRIGRCCRACASRSGGGCCSWSMAGESDELQLLMNLLAGIEVRLIAQVGDSCPFLAPDGCQFLFKPMFCLNYLCQEIRSRSDRAALDNLEVLTGTLLQRQYALEQILLDWLRPHR